jgi:hypothetical protein
VGQDPHNCATVVDWERSRVTTVAQLWGSWPASIVDCGTGRPAHCRRPADRATVLAMILGLPLLILLIVFIVFVIRAVANRND